MIQGFPHPGGLQHPGMPHGQPMGPGHGAHPGQPMGQPMQMHPGVSGPNGPHVTQAGPMMAGMQPGVGGPGGGTPNSHAMQHLAPQMQQHQMMQQQMMSNPALVRQMQQQQQYLQHQRMMQQQQGQGGMPMNFPNSGHPGMTPQQFAALQSGNGPQGVVLPQHLQMQQAMMQQRHQQALQLQHQQPSHQQQQAAQQQQAQHQQAQAQQAQQAQAQQAQAQQAQQQHAQSMAMQHAASQQSNQGQPPQSAPSSQPQQGPMRPPTAMGNTPQAHSSPAPPPSQQQSAPPQATPTTQAPQQSPAPQQSQPQNQQQQQQQQQAQQSQGQQQGQASGQQQPQQQAQNPGQAAANQQRQLLNNQQAAAARLQQQQQVKMFRGNAMLKLLQFTDHLGKFKASQQPNDIDYWRGFVADFFSEEGELRQTIHDNSQNKPKQFDICFAALPRYFFKQYESGVEQIQIFFGDSIEKSFNNQCHFVEARGAKFIYWFANGTQVVGTGRLTALIGQGDKIETLEFNHNEHQTYLSRSQLEELFARGSPNQKQSPRMTKTTGKQRNQQRLQQPIEPTLALSDLPSAPITDFGVTEAILSYLEIGETLSHMQPLISYSQQHTDQTPGDALRNLVSQYNQAAAVAGQQQGMQQQQAGGQQQFHNQHLMNAQNGMHPGQQMQPGVRTPSNPGQGFMMSPAVQNSLLPGQNPVNGSPHTAGNVNLNAANLAGGHTPSPAMGHMQAPNMVAQLSQQGNSGGSTATLSSGTAVSANTSPNVSGKRRRPSAVKGEGDDGDGPGVNGAAKVKASPRGGGNKRIKGNQ